jgi:hypothetical protein
MAQRPGQTDEGKGTGDGHDFFWSTATVHTTLLASWSVCKTTTLSCCVTPPIQLMSIKDSTS